MAKTRQIHSVKQAIAGITAALRIDAIANPTEEQKKQRQDAIINACDVIDNSGVITMAETADENIETGHQVDAILEAGGIDPVQMRRDSALAGAEMAVAVEQSKNPVDENDGVGEPPAEPTE